MVTQKTKACDIFSQKIKQMLNLKYFLVGISVINVLRFRKKIVLKVKLFTLMVAFRILDRLLLNKTYNLCYNDLVN